MLSSYRKRFNNFKKTLEYKEIQKVLLHKQLYCCCICKLPISLNSNTHYYHAISLFDTSLIHKVSLVNNINNLVLSCSKCNLKQNKNTNFNLITDISKLLTLKELALIVYKRNYKVNVLELYDKS